jgi:hypothetical protein
MNSKVIELPSSQAEREFDVVPKQGDFIKWNGKPHLIVRVNVVNNAKLEMMVVPKRERKEFEDFSCRSVEWTEFSDSFFDEESSNSEINNLYGPKD